MRVVDSHCHLDDRQFDTDRDAAVARARAAGVETMLVIGTGEGPPDLETAIRLAEKHEFIYATVGVHPHDARKASEETFLRLARLAKHPKVVALGEIGLDYHYDFSPRDVQRAVFERQLALAAAAGLPVVIHTREAWEDTMSILRANWHGEGIMHCFTGDAAQAREAARLTPPERLLVETDSPYLAPVPMRGKRNEPAFIVETVRRLAEIRSSDAGEIAVTTTGYFERLCLRPPLPNR